MKGTKYKYEPHTAEVAFIAFGKDLKGAIENSAEALLNIMLDLKKINKASVPSNKIPIKESAGTIENLVWYTLQSILTKVDDKKLRAYKFKISKLSQKNKFTISGNLFYKKLKQDPFMLEVKAVTPHELIVKERKNGYEIHVLVDV